MANHQNKEDGGGVQRAMARTVICSCTVNTRTEDTPPHPDATKYARVLFKVLDETRRDTISYLRCSNPPYASEIFFQGWPIHTSYSYTIRTQTTTMNAEKDPFLPRTNVTIDCSILPMMACNGGFRLPMTCLVREWGFGFYDARVSSIILQRWNVLRVIAILFCAKWILSGHHRHHDKRASLGTFCLLALVVGWEALLRSFFKTCESVRYSLNKKSWGE
jgi:hypothetical protein